MGYPTWFKQYFSNFIAGAFAGLVVATVFSLQNSECIKWNFWTIKTCNKNMLLFFIVFLFSFFFGALIYYFVFERKTKLEEFKKVVGIKETEKPKKIDNRESKKLKILLGWILPSLELNSYTRREEFNSLDDNKKQLFIDSYFKIIGQLNYSVPYLILTTIVLMFTMVISISSLGFYIYVIIILIIFLILITRFTVKTCKEDVDDLFNWLTRKENK
jgi:Flp pilus assembly protein TadB